MTARPLQHVTVLLGDPSLPDPTKPSGHFAPEDLDTVVRLREALESLGRYELTYLDRHGQLEADLKALRPPFVFNLCDTGLGNIPTREWHVATLLESLEIPYSGAPPAAMAICYDKGLVSALARSMGIPVPDERYFDAPEEAMTALDALALPALIKPNQADGSLGITAKAVVHTSEEARAYLKWLGESLPGRAVLVQEYLPGPEYSVGLVGNPRTRLDALPVLQADFSSLPEGCTPICCYESKAVPDSPYWSGINYRAAPLSGPTLNAVLTNARRLFTRLGLRDYGRIDFRTDAAGTIKMMEVNPNPAWAYDGKLNLMANLGGRDYPHLLESIIEAALARIALTN